MFIEFISILSPILRCLRNHISSAPNTLFRSRFYSVHPRLKARLSRTSSSYASPPRTFLRKSLCSTVAMYILRQYLFRSIAFLRVIMRVFSLWWSVDGFLSIMCNVILQVFISSFIHHQAITSIDRWGNRPRRASCTSYAEHALVYLRFRSNPSSASCSCLLSCISSR